MMLLLLPQMTTPPSTKCAGPARVVIPSAHRPPLVAADWLTPHGFSRSDAGGNAAAKKPCGSETRGCRFVDVSRCGEFVTSLPPHFVTESLRATSRGSPSQNLQETF
ncbi:unnamed protein product [Lampetra fluviatilis]